MVGEEHFRILSDEEKAQYKFGFCEGCPVYECELVGEYTQFRESHAKINKPPILVSECVDVDSFGYIKKTVIQRTTVNAECNEQDGNIYSTNSCPIDTDSSDAEIFSYDQSKLKNCCVMNRNIYQVECGRKKVTEGIGNHYKIEITEELKKDCLSRKKIIKEGTKDRWEPLQPVFISAQTGQGKNYFIENTLIPYVRELNYKEKTSNKILIFSNRLALKQQINYRIDGNTDLDNEEENSEEGQIYPYKEVAEVMTYQSLMRKEGYLKKVHSKYIYVICDEAHFFTSDAMFNPHTHKILETIVRLFQNAVRVYMSATPYECLEFIIKCEEEEQKRLNLKKYGGDQSKWKYEKMVFYHFKRDYSYLDVKTYSSISELYDEIVESVGKRKEKWLVFIDDKEKCKKVKTELEKISDDKKYPLMIEEKKDKKDVKDAETDKDNEEKKKVERVFAVDADSKKDPVYQEILNKEMLNKDTYVLISTSVLDNGVNLTGIKNIVVSDMEKTKCLQMVGRARRSNKDERKTLYMKRFCADETDKRIKNLMKQQDAYHSYELAYDENGNACSPGVYQFFNKYYRGKEADWKDAKHWFGISFGETKWHLNKIAKSLAEKLIPQYQYISDEMEEEKNEQQNQESENRMGQKYLEYQLSWLGKKYCEDDNITVVGTEQAKEKFLSFLEAYAKSGEKIAEEEEMETFQAEFTRLHDAVFLRADKNINRSYKYKKMNEILMERNIKYRLDGRPQKGPWKVIRTDENELSQTDVSDMQADEENIQEKNIESIAEKLDTREKADNDDTALPKSKTKKHFKIDPKFMKENTMRCKSKKGRR